jgi:hypothetical protein
VVSHPRGKLNTFGAQTEGKRLTDAPSLPSLELVLDQVASERKTLDDRLQGLDGRAGIVLGFAGVLIGLGATAQPAASNTVVFQCGLGVAVLAASLAAATFLPQPSSAILDIRPARQLLSAPEADTRLALLDTQIAMVEMTKPLVSRKVRLIGFAVLLLAGAAALVVLGVLAAGTPHHS